MPKTAPPTPAARPRFISKQVTEARRYYLDLTPPRSRRITVVCGGVERCRPDYAIRRRSFRFACIEFVAEGEGQLTLAGRNYHLRPGMAFAYRPGVPHIIRNDPARPMLKYYVDFVGSAADEMLAHSPLGRWEVAQVSSPHEVVEIYESLQRNGIGDSPFSAGICAALIPLLILKITEKAIPYDAAETRALPAYQRAKRYIEQHYLRLKTVEQVAAACHVNPAHLCRLFRRFDHVTPYQSLMRLKMNKAAELLLDSGMLIKEVASALDFADPYHFSRTFKKIYGLSPERFIQHGRRGGRR
jgi:AraC-like DNA-binding protein